MLFESFCCVLLRGSLVVEQALMSLKPEPLCLAEFSLIHLNIRETLHSAGKLPIDSYCLL